VNLNFLPSYVGDILSGRKRATIRLGRKDLRKGMYVNLVASGRIFARGRIVRVEHKKLKELREEEIKKEGARNFRELLAELRRIYPAISPEDEITYIEWTITGR
jgi:hypothetical protein